MSWGIETILYGYIEFIGSYKPVGDSVILGDGVFLGFGEGHGITP
jgi:hypothetical protein